MTQNINDALAQTLLADKKRERRWKNIRFFIGASLIVLYAILIFSPKPNTKDPLSKHPYVALVRLNGMIMPNMSFSARRAIPLLTQAFKDKRAKGVVLVINSPGGSPVQASIIHDKILQLREKYHKKVVVIGEDTLASAAYLVATSANKIYVNPDTLTGSIGVIMSGFGLNQAISKIGITRRVYTAGAHKDRLDPFLPQNADDTAKVHQLLDTVHQNFIADVMQGRKGLLKGNPKVLFSGDFWSGTTAVKLGLADQTGNLWGLMKKEFNVTHYKTFKRHSSLLSKMISDISASLPYLPISLATHTQLQASL